MAGIYIHIPFCRQACTYCNFYFSTSLAQKSELIRALCKEIILTQNFISPGEIIETIYFGGGTPSLLTYSELEELFDALNKKFSIHPEAEITLEANPDDISKTSLAMWKNAGINRLSVGIQSFKEDELRWMNRAHTSRQSWNCIDEIQEAGFNNFSADLIFGSPLCVSADLKTSLQMIFEENIPHVSCYALTVEPKTALNTMIGQKQSPPVNNEKQAEQFLLIINAMKEHNYEHYEISNFAKPGMRSKHNSSYWSGTPFYGFGPSAHSFNGSNKRRWNIANNSLYIQSLLKNEIPFEEETLSDTQQLNEYIMTSLRTQEGMNTDFVSRKFGAGNLEKIIKSIQKYLNTNRLIIQDSHIILTSEGKLFADGIAADLFQ